ncbi:MAG: hypothetical protein LBQ44_03015, partial [Treponema sp.]|nr:hypothetical protein [Treponema sp.]
MKRFPGLAPAAFLLLSLASCSARITGRLARDASGNVELSAALEPNAASLIRGFASLRGPLPAAAPLLDAAALNRSLLSSPGVKSSALRNTAPESIAGTIAISRIGELLASETSPSSGPAPRGGFIRYEEPSGTAPGRLSLYLDRSQAPR